MATKDLILVIEDDPDIAELVKYNLERENFSVLVFGDGEQGLREVQLLKPQLVVLDLMLPQVDGIEICRQIKQGTDTKHTPIIILTAKSEESDVVLGLGIGADDYVTKPFSPRELVARVKAVLRRNIRVGASFGVTTGAISSPLVKTPRTAPSQDNLKVGSLLIDLDRHEVTVNGQMVGLTLAEFRLLHALASRPGRVFTREELLDHITGGDAVVIDRNVDVHIRSIRKKMGESNDIISTVRGVGYKCKELT